MAVVLDLYSRRVVVWSMQPHMTTQRTDRKTYRNRGDAKADVVGYIEVFYNGKRRHPTIGYIGPIQFEQQVQLA